MQDNKGIVSRGKKGCLSVYVCHGSVLRGGNGVVSAGWASPTSMWAVRISFAAAMASAQTSASSALFSCRDVSREMVSSFFSG